MLGKVQTLSLILLTFNILTGTATGTWDVNTETNMAALSTHSDDMTYFQMLTRAHTLANMTHDERDGYQTTILKHIASFMRGAHRVGETYNFTRITNQLSKWGRNQSIKELEYMRQNEPFLWLTISSMLEASELSKRQGFQSPKHQQQRGSQCANDTGRAIVGFLEGELYGLLMMDASGKPGPALSRLSWNFVGSYKLCRSIVAPQSHHLGSEGFSGQYAYVVMRLEKEGGRGLIVPNELQPSIGLCMPSTCSVPEMHELFNKAIGIVMSLVKSKIDGFPVEVSVGRVEIRDETRQVTAASKAAFSILIILGILSVVGTSYDAFLILKHRHRQQENDRTDGLINHARDFPDTTSSEVRDGDNGVSASRTYIGSEQTPLLEGTTATDDTVPRQGKLSRSILAFSLYTNVKDIVKVRPHTSSSGNIACLHGMRFFSINWVVLGHTYSKSITYVSNIFDIQYMLNSWSHDVITNGLPSVDTFFCMSGILLAYNTIKEMKRAGTWRVGWGWLYLHRYLRLTLPYMMTLVLLMGLQRFMGSGAQWRSQMEDASSCERLWWTNVLYVNNFFGKDGYCKGETWYLANDMQFFVLSPILLIPLYLKPYLGMAISVLLLLITRIATVVVSVNHEFPVSVTDIAHGKSVSSMHYYYDNYYVMPHSRCGPYVVGILAGYILAVNGGKIKLTRYTNALGWLLATSTALAIVYGLRGEFSGEAPVSVWTAAFYNGFSHTAWGACICWVTFSCASGYGGFVNRFLSWPPLEVLARLSYMVYLTHSNVIDVFYQNMDQTFFSKDLTMVIFYLGILCMSYMTAFVLSVMLESPTRALEKIFLS